MGTEVEVIAGFQYEMTEVENDGYLDFYLWPEYSPHGYVWMIPKKGGRAKRRACYNRQKRSHQIP
jgi:flavin-dependent dehydrogenase